MPERASDDGSRASNDELLEKEIAELRKKTPFWRRHAPLIIINSIVFLIYAGVLSAVASNVPKQCSKGPNLVFCKLVSLIQYFQTLTKAAPAYEAVEWEEYTFKENSQEHGPFSGYPRDEIDKNWDDLLNGKNCSVSISKDTF